MKHTRNESLCAAEAQAELDKSIRELEEMFGNAEDASAAVSPPAKDALDRSCAIHLSEVPKPVTPPAGVYQPPASIAAHGMVYMEEALHNQLTTLCGEKDSAGQLREYLSIREDYCRLQLALNGRGARPPSFRSGRKRPKNAKGAGWDTFSKDQMIIDLNWLHRWTPPREIDEEEFRDLLANSEFDFGEAALYASKVWKTEIRVLRLGLTPMDQWQLSVLVTDEVRTQLKSLRARHSRVEASLRGLSQLGARLHVDDAVDFARLWFAAELAYGGGLDAVARIHGWMRGSTPLSRPTTSLKLRRMRVWVAKTGM